MSLEEAIIRQIDKKLFRTIRIVTVLKWTVATLSLIGLAIAIFLRFFREKFSPMVGTTIGVAQSISQKNGNNNDMQTSRDNRISIVSYDKNIDLDLKQRLD